MLRSLSIYLSLSLPLALSLSLSLSLVLSPSMYISRAGLIFFEASFSLVCCVVMAACNLQTICGVHASGMRRTDGKGYMYMTGQGVARNPGQVIVQKRGGV